MPPAPRWASRGSSGGAPRAGADPMFNLANETPYAAERTLVCDKDGRDVWVVAVKGTFLIKPDGTTVLADKQEPVEQSPVHFGDPLTSSLKYECDLDYTKPTTDVLLHGHAYAPKGKPTTQVEVAMKLASIDKALRVTGDRSWQEGVLGLRLSEPEPFLKMPLLYERSFGGTDLRSDHPKRRGWEPRNPVGTGYDAGSGPSPGQMAPNIEAASSSLIRGQRPAGFGPIARHWAPRAHLAGTYDAAGSSIELRYCRRISTSDSSSAPPRTSKRPSTSRATRRSS